MTFSSPVAAKLHNTCMGREHWYHQDTAKALSVVPNKSNASAAWAHFQMGYSRMLHARIIKRMAYSWAISTAG